MYNTLVYIVNFALYIVQQPGIHFTMQPTTDNIYSIQAVVLGSKRDIRLLGYSMADSVQVKAAKQGLLALMMLEKVLIL